MKFTRLQADDAGWLLRPVRLNHCLDETIRFDELQSHQLHTALALAIAMKASGVGMVLLKEDDESVWHDFSNHLGRMLTDARGKAGDNPISEVFTAQMVSIIRGATENLHAKQLASGDWMTVSGLVKDGQSRNERAGNAKIKSDPAASYWLKEQLAVAQNRDPVDMLNDLDALKAYLEADIEELGTVI